MRKRFLVGVLCGLILGVTGSLCVRGWGSYPSPILMRPVSVQPATVAPPNVPADAGRLRFNGLDYYIVPLSDGAQKSS
jgi:hypothetical protein